MGWRFPFLRDRVHAAESRLAVLRVDGGICSQIAFVALGEQLREQGLDVKYDLSFYRDRGRDDNGRFARNWEFPSAFPGIPTPEASDAEVRLARGSRTWSGGVHIPRPPFLYDGYQGRQEAFYANVARFANAFRPDLSKADAVLRDAIAAEAEACAVHVRRGDLSVANAAYGRPASILYFVRAMAIVRALAPDAKFFIFSDEPDWVRAHLLREVPADLRCTVCEANGSDRGHADLWLISRCPHVIASQGSLGLFGALLSGGANRTLVLRRHDPYVAKMLPHVMYINDDCGPCQEGDVK